MRRQATQHVQEPRRGRPLQLPFDETEPSAPSFAPWPRIAWLLVFLRMSNQDRDLTQRAVFRDRLRDQGVPADLSRISRWESGRSTVPPQVVTAYESVLGLPAGSVLAITRALVRNAGTSGLEVAAPVGRHEADDGLDDLLDRATRDDPGPSGLSGGEWLRLSLLTTRYDAIYLGTHVWSDVCTRLMSELARTVGNDRFLRYEACVNLVCHPVARRPVLRSLGQWLTDPDVQIADPMMGLLLELTDDGATQLVLRLLSSATRPVADAAVPVLAAKVARGHVGEAGLREAEAFVSGRLGADASIDPHVADVLAQLPPVAFVRATTGVRDPAVRTRLDALVQTRLLTDVTTARTTVRSLAGQVQDEVDSVAGRDADRMLHTLLRESLFHAHGLRRHLAARTLALTPFVEPLTAAVVDLAGTAEPATAVRALTMVRWLGATATSTGLVDAALADTRAPVQAAALHALSQASEALEPRTSNQLADLATGSPHRAVRRAATAVLGLRAPGTLAAIAGGADDDLRRAAAWWARTGSVLVDPAPGVRS